MIPLARDWTRLGVLPAQAAGEPDWLTGLRSSADPLAEAVLLLESGSVTDAELSAVFRGGDDMWVIRSIAARRRLK